MMICEHCKQRHANVKVTQVVDDQQVNHHYCEICATQFYPTQLEHKQEPMKLHQLLSSWFGTPSMQQDVGNQMKQSSKQQTCPKCGFSYQRFLKEGKLGCAMCYETFRHELPPIFSRLQAASTHIGKMPVDINNTIALKKKIKELRTEMQVAIVEERFEDAAKLRDEVKEIEYALQTKGGM